MLYKQAKKLIDDFLTYLDVEKRASTHTYKSYSYDLQQLCRFWDKTIKEQKLQKRTTQSNLQEILEKFFMHLYKQHVQKSSIARKIACFKSFAKYVQSCGITIELHLTTPRLSKKLPTYLTVDEINYLLDQLPDTSLKTTRPLRDRTILETLYATGIRCSELCNIELQDINFDQQTILITGKGNKQRYVLFGKKAKEKMLQYIQIERIKDEKNKSHHLFLNTHGTAILPRTVQQILQKFSKHLPIKKQLTPHKIRHTFATHMLNAGINLRALQELLGHATLTTTEKYTHVATKDLKELYQKINPLKLSEHKV